MELTAYNGSTYTARYTGFRVADAADKYRLEYDRWDEENSTVGTFDALERSKSQFSTVDQDNDVHSDSCSSLWGGGGWWFSNCAWSGLTGINHNEETHISPTGIYWIHRPAILPAGQSGSWPAAVMKMRRTDAATHGTSLTTTTKRSTTPTTVIPTSTSAWTTILRRGPYGNAQV